MRILHRFPSKTKKYLLLNLSLFSLLSFLLVLAVVVNLPHSSKNSSLPNVEPENVATPQGPVKGQVVLTFKKNATEKEKQEYIVKLNGKVVGTIKALNAVVVSVPEDTNTEKLPTFSKLTNSEPDYYVSILADSDVNNNPNDPRFEDQWSLPVIGWTSFDLSQSENKTIAVIDSGICADNAELKDRIVEGYDFVEGDNLPQDENGHGCEVSGVVASNMNNGIGITGVAPSAKVMPLKVLDASGIGTYSNVANAIVYAVDHKVNVINLSLGGTSPSSVLENAINYAKTKNVIVVAAAGNTGTSQVLYPAAYDYVVSVGSVDPSIQNASDVSDPEKYKSSFSSYGSGVDVWAPGRDILTINKNGNYGYVSGTSFAAPIVSAMEAEGVEVKLVGGIGGDEDQNKNDQQINTATAQSTCGGINDPDNPFDCCASGGNCTWWAAHKRPELAQDMKGSGSAAAWWTTAINKGYATGQTPKVGAIAVWGNGTDGHVAYVEEVIDDNNFKVSEMNCYGGPAGPQTIPVTKTSPRSPFLGFIYNEAPAQSDDAIIFYENPNYNRDSSGNYIGGEYYVIRPSHYSSKIVLKNLPDWINNKTSSIWVGNSVCSYMFDYDRDDMSLPENPSSVSEVEWRSQGPWYPLMGSITDLLHENWRVPYNENYFLGNLNDSLSTFVFAPRCQTSSQSLKMQDTECFNMSGSTSTPPTTQGDNSDFVSDVNIPDGTTLPANYSFTKTWRLKNIGSTTWNQNYKLVYQSGTRMTNVNSVSLPTIVAPNGTLDISVNLTSPSSNGSYTGNWILTNQNNEQFGDVVWVKINVNNTTQPPSGSGAVKLYGVTGYSGLLGSWQGDTNDPAANSYSMEITNGWSVRTFKNDNFSGEERCWYESVPNLQDHSWQNAIQSMKIYSYNYCSGGGKVKLYANANYENLVGEYDLGKTDGPSKNSYSMLIPTNWSVITYDQDGQHGRNRCWSSSVPNLQDHESWNLAIDSMETFPTNVCPDSIGSIRICRDTGGTSCDQISSSAPSLGNIGFGNDTLKSIYTPADWVAVLFEDDNYGGRFYETNTSQNDLGFLHGSPGGFDPNGYGTSSMQIRKVNPAVFSLYRGGDYNDGAPYKSDRSIPDLSFWKADNGSWNDKAQSIRVDGNYEIIGCTDAGYHGTCGRTKTDKGDINDLAQGLRNGISSVQVCLGTCPPSPTAPVLNSPLDQVYFLPGSQLTFNWDGNGETFFAEISGGGLTGTVTRDWNNQKTWNVSTLPASSNPYTWRVKAWNPYGEGNWSTSKTFYVQDIAPTQVYLTGASKADMNTDVTLNAYVNPVDASNVNYTWSPAPQSGQGTASAVYNFTTAGDKTITLTVANTGGSSSTTHIINVSCPDGTYLAEYYANKTLTGQPVVSKCEERVDHNWQTGKVLPEVGIDTGDGRDGNLTVNAGDTIYTDNVRTTLKSAADVNEKSISVNNATGFNTGDEVLVIKMYDSTNVGAYDVAKIASINGTNFVLENPLRNSYPLTPSWYKVQVVRIPQYHDVTINGILTAHAWNGDTGGIVVFKAQGTVNIGIAGSIDVKGKGYRSPMTRYGGAGTQQLQGEGSYGTGGAGSSYNGSGGGGGKNETGDNAYNMRGAGGGGSYWGGDNAASVYALGGGRYLINDLSQRMTFGGAGGVGPTDWRNSTGDKQNALARNGGGIIAIFANQVNAADGLINASGENAYTGSACTFCEGGGGAGGSVYVSAISANIGTNRLQALGGIHSGSRDDGSGDAGAGIVHVDYGNSLTGTTSTNAFVTKQVYGGNDNFSARWTNTFTFNEGGYKFIVKSDDGAKLWVDNNLVIDKWADGYNETTAELQLTAGTHSIKLEYYENTDSAQVHLNISPAGNHAPVITQIPDQTVNPGAAFTKFSLDNYASDPDGDRMNYTYSGNDKLQVSVDANNEVAINAPANWSGKETITFTATDILGESASRSVIFEVLKCAQGKYLAEYYANKDLSGQPAVSKCEDKIDYNWQAGTPVSNIGMEVGDGRDGSITVNAGDTAYTDNTRTTLQAATPSSSKAIQVASASGLTVGDQILIIKMYSATDVGIYDIAKITAINGTTLTLLNPLRYVYPQSQGSDRVQVIRIPQYVDVTVNGTLTAHPWDGNTGGIVIFKAIGNVVVNATGKIDTKGKGYRSATTRYGGGSTQQQQGEGSIGVGGASNLYNGSGGGGGKNETGDNAYNMKGAGGGGSYFSGDNSGSVYGRGGGRYLLDVLSQRMTFGGAGGVGGTDWKASNGDKIDPLARNGGGIIAIFANQLNTTAGSIDASGMSSTACAFCEGGGGAGGSVYISALNAAIGTSKVVALGGLRYGSRDDASGEGGAGLVYVEYGQTLTGTSPQLIHQNQVYGGNDSFSVRWSSKFTTPANTYNFVVKSDDGAKLWVDGNLQIDKWVDGYNETTKEIALTAGMHDIKLEYYESIENAQVQLNIIPLTNHGPVITQIPDQMVAPDGSFTKFDLDNYASDSDGDMINYTFSGNTNLQVSIDVNNQVTVTAPSGWAGKETITFKATDTWGESVSKSATFEVLKCPVGQFYTEYFANKDLAGNAALARCESSIDYNWGTQGPDFIGSFGNGHDGALTISTNTTDNPIDSATSGTSGTKTLSATNTGFAVGQKILIHQTRGTNAGTYQITEITGYAAGTITTKDSLISNYISDSGANKAQVIVIKQYTDVTVNSGVTWRAKAWDGSVGGILMFTASGNANILGTINVDGEGFRGGSQLNAPVGVNTAGDQGEGTTAGPNGRSINPNCSGGGGGWEPDNNGGAGGGNGTAGANGWNNYAKGGLVSGNTELTNMNLGGGGGSGAPGGGGMENGLAGGAGGGIIGIYANSLTVSGTGKILSEGANGGIDSKHFGGGAGAGGSVKIMGRSVNIGTNLIAVGGGVGGGSRAGGAGGNGRLRIEYCGTLSGQATSASVAQVTCTAGSFSARWSGKVTTAASPYNFIVKSDDGSKLWVDNTLQADQWVDGYNETTKNVELTAGIHDVKLEYYQNTGDSQVHLNIVPATNHAPEISTIPDQTIDSGTAFTKFDLDNFTNDPDGDIIRYSYSGNTNLQVAIDGNNEVTVTSPVNWNGSETITFTATDTWGESSSKTVTFEVLKCPVGKFYTEYFINKDLTGTPVLTRCEDTVNQNWGTSSFDLRPAPVAAYSFENNLNDSAGGARNGVGYGGLTYNSSGKFGNSVYLNGATGYIDIPNAPQIAGGNFTVTGWFLTAGAAQQTIFSFTSKNSPYAAAITSEIEPDGKFYYVARDPVDLVGGAEIMTSPIGANDGNWHHFASVHDGTQLKLYIDGNLIGTAEGNVIAPYPAAFVIGRLGETWSQRYFSGALDEIQIYDQTLNETQVKMNMYAPTPYSDNFSTRWTNSVPFTAGTYTFNVKSDDGARLWIDGNLQIDKWLDGYSQTNKDVTLTDGNHDIKLEYYDHTGAAQAQLTWATANQSPTDITLSNSSIEENVIIGTEVGTLATTDPDTGSTFVYSLVSGTGSDDNASFIIDGDKLKTAAAFDFETKNSYRVRVKTTDQSGGSFEKVFTITINNINEAPVLTTIPAQTIEEDSSFAVFDLDNYASDPDAGDALVYSFSNNSDLSVSIDTDNKVTVAAASNWNGEENITFIATDKAGLATATTALFKVNAVNDAPVITSTPITIAQVNQAYNYHVSVIDVDNMTLVYNLPTAPVGMIIGASGMISWTPDDDNNEISDVVVSVSDGSLATTQSFQVTILNFNKAPSKPVLQSPANEAVNLGLTPTLLWDPSVDLNNDPIKYDIYLGTDIANLPRVSADQSVQSFTTGTLAYSTVYYWKVIAKDGRGGVAESLIYSFTTKNENHAPTDISLSSADIAENLPIGTEIGSLSAADPDNSESFTYTLVTGTGSTDNTSFTISDNRLKTNEVFNFETKNSYSIRIKAVDHEGLSFEKVFTLTVSNVNETPTDLALSAASIEENKIIGTEVGTLTTTDLDSENSFTCSLVTGTGSTDNASFSIADDKLKIAASFDYEAKNSYSIRVKTADQGGLSFEKAFTIIVINLNEAPTDISLSNSSIAENQIVGTEVGTLTSIDQDSGDVVTYSLVTGTGSDDNANFTIAGNKIKTTSGFDFEAKSSYSIRIKATDQGNLIFEKVFTIVVTNVNESPSNLALSKLDIAENSATGSEVGTLTTTDPDDGNTFIYTLVTDTGSADNTSFTIAGDKLKTAASFNFETKNSYNIRVRTTDQDGLLFEKAITIAVNDVNETPIMNIISDQTINEDNVFTIFDLDNYASDPDAGDVLTFSFSGNTGLQVSIDADNKVTVSAPANWNGQENITFKATDKSGLFATKESSFKVNPVNDAPIITSTPITSALIGQQYRYHVSIADVDSSAFTYSLTTAPIGMVIDNAGMIFWTPDDSHDEISDVVVSVSDGDLTATQSFSVTILDFNKAPSKPALQSPVNGAVKLALTQTLVWDSSIDPNNDPIKYDVYLGTDQDSLAKVSADQTIQSYQTNTLAYSTTYYWKVVAKDGRGGTAESLVFSFTTRDENRAPTNISLSNMNVEENLPIGTEVGTMTTIDPDAGNTFTYSLVTGTGSTDNASFMISTDKLKTTASFNYEAKNSYSIRAKATDQEGLSIEEILIITVENVNEVPFINAIPTQTIDEDGVFISFDLDNYASDPDAGDALTFSFSGNTGLQVSIDADNKATIISPKDWNGQENITFTATDKAGLKASTTTLYKVNPVNDTPVITSAPITVAAVDRQYQYHVDVTDVDSTVFTYLLRTAPVGLTIDNNGLITWTPVAVNMGNNDVSVQISDGSRVARQDFVITVSYSTDDFVNQIDDKTMDLANWKQDATTGFNVTNENEGLKVQTVLNVNAKKTIASTKWIVVNSNKKYYLAANIKTQKADQAKVSINLYDVNYNLLGTPKILAGASGTKDWTEFRTTYLVPAKYNSKVVKYAKLVLTAGDRSSASATEAITYFDDLYFSTNGRPYAGMKLTPAIVKEGDSVLLNGSTSKDPDGTIGMHYLWSQVDGPAVKILNANLVNANFLAPSDIDKNYTITIKLVVSDTITSSIPLLKTITVNGFIDPLAEEFRDQKNWSNLTSNDFATSIENESLLITSNAPAKTSKVTLVPLVKVANVAYKLAFRIRSENATKANITINGYDAKFNDTTYSTTCSAKDMVGTKPYTDFNCAISLFQTYTSIKYAKVTINFTGAATGAKTWIDYIQLKNVSADHAPVITQIPAQTINQGQNFFPIDLKNYVTDIDANDKLIWTFKNSSQIKVLIDSNSIATLTYPFTWNGSGTITFTATDLAKKAASTNVVFKVNVVPQWINASNTLSESRSGSLTVLKDGRILLTDGAASVMSKSAEIYDPTLNVWTKIPDMQKASMSHSATLLKDGRVLVVGGYSGSSAINSAEIYNPTTNTWTSAGNLSAGRYGHTASLLSNGKVLIVGGFNGSTYSLPVEIYNPTTNTWAIGPKQLVDRSEHTATTISGGKVLIIGGYNGNVLSSVELYDPSTNKWSTKASMNNVRTRHTSTLLVSGKVIVVGGWNGDMLNTAELYNPSKNTWTSTANMPDKRSDHTAEIVNGKLFIIGGCKMNDSATNAVTIYDPVTGLWSSGPNLNSIRRWHKSIVLGGKTVLAVGGENGSGTVIDRTEILSF